jgi:hypothetical protein
MVGRRGRAEGGDREDSEVMRQEQQVHAGAVALLIHSRNGHFDDKIRVVSSVLSKREKNATKNTGK